MDLGKRERGMIKIRVEEQQVILLTFAHQKEVKR